MKIIKNKLSNIGKAKCDCENLDSLPFIPHEPLPAKNFAIAFIGVPKSGKSNVLQQLLTSKKTKKSNLYYRGNHENEDGSTSDTIVEVRWRRRAIKRKLEMFKEANSPRRSVRLLMKKCSNIDTH